MPFDTLATLSSVCSLIVDCPHSTPVWTNSGHVVIRNQNIKGGRLDLSNKSFTDTAHFQQRIRRAKPQFGDLVITREAPMGEVCLIPRGLECCLGQRQVLLRPNPAKINPRFLLYAIQSTAVQNQIAWNEGTGSTVSNIRIPVLESIKIPLPPLLIQDEVAEMMGGLDDKIALLRDTNATLEAIVQALFKSWFVDFDPVRAKAEGRDPEGMPTEMADLFTSEFEDSELGAIPKGWLRTSLGTLCSLTKGCSYKGSGLSDDSGAYMFNLGCFNARRVYANQNIKRYTGEYKPRHEVGTGDLIIANTDMTQARDILGRPLLVPKGFSPGFVSHHVFRVAMVPEFDYPQAKAYLFFALQEPRFRERAIGFATGTTVLAMPKEAVEEYQVPLPPPPLLKAFGQVVAPILERVEQGEIQSGSLAKIRDTLLPRIMSGKLRIPDAEEVMA